MRSNLFKLGLAAIFSLGSILGATSASAYDDELLIGDFQILSGAAASGGLGNHRGLMLAIKHYNEGVHPLNKTKGLTVGGKTYKLTTVVYDHKYTTEGGITSANKLVFDDGAKFHVSNGLYLEDVMKSINLPYTVIKDKEDIPMIGEAYKHSRKISRPTVAMLPKQLLQGQI